MLDPPPGSDRTFCRQRRESGYSPVFHPSLVSPVEIFLEPGIMAHHPLVEVDF